MADYVFPEISVPQTAADDPRIGQLLGRGLDGDTTPRAVILGFGVDEGVRRNQGRPGAADGPDAIRNCFFRFAPGDTGTEELLRQTRDLGNLAVSGDLEQDQLQLGEALAPWLEQNVVAIVMGGGHETAYGHFLAYANTQRPVHIVNVDAHADVRELRDGLGHSGSPFRQALEHASGLCAGYTVLGLQPTANAQAHLQFVADKGGHAVLARDLNAAMLDNALDHSAENIYATFCLDAVDQAFAPGVSAPASNGLTPELWLHAAHSAGVNPLVRSMDIVELNPRFDRDDQTARLAARTLFEFLRGLATR